MTSLNGINYGDMIKWNGSSWNLVSDDSFALGSYAGQSTQGSETIAIGGYAGQTGQGRQSLSIGRYAGNNNQGTESIALGYNAGNLGQGSQSLALGNNAGQTGQGSASIAIGYKAGYSNQASNTIIINATGAQLNSSNSNGLFIKPIRQQATNLPTLVYNNTTGEITADATKTFVINHPTKPDNYLVHAAIEGPEAGVYYRGEAKIENDKFVKITLPDYVSAFADNFTIQITQIYEENQDQNVIFKTSRVKDNAFTVYGSNGSFYWVVYGQRGKVEVEPKKSDVELKGDGPYKYLRPKK
jgi:hypothetical protein